MVTDYTWPATRERPGYTEQPSRCSVDPMWYDPQSFQPPLLTEVLATDGSRVKEAWLGPDGVWMRFAAPWEFVFGQESPVVAWRHMPQPPGEIRITLHRKDGKSC